MDADVLAFNLACLRKKVTYTIEPYYHFHSAIRLQLRLHSCVPSPCFSRCTYNLALNTLCGFWGADSEVLFSPSCRWGLDLKEGMQKARSLLL